MNLVPGNEDSQGNISVIKRIQKGTFIDNDSDSSVSITLTKFTDINKMIAIVNGSRYEFKSDGDDLAQTAYIIEFTVSKLTIATGSRDGVLQGYYQVIEFY